MRILLFIGFVLLSQLLHAQTYETLILQHRENYKKEFLEDEKSPLKEKDLPFLDFYKVSPAYLLQAKFTRIEDESGFDMPTHSGVLKKYVVYGKLDFTLSGKPYQLFVYQSVILREKKGFEDYLFIPFHDETNGEETYGGGRYLDLRMKEIKDGYVQLDFNKCYNPYCAYKGGYSCPIPPVENKLLIPIKAGEKKFKLDIEE